MLIEIKLNIYKKKLKKKDICQEMFFIFIVLLDEITTTEIKMNWH